MSKEKTFQIPAILEGIGHLKDGSLSLRFHTQEIPDDEKLVLLSFFQAFGHLLFKENAFTDTDIPKEDASDRDKTPSQRLRAVMFIMWKQQGSKGDFDQFYNQKMNFIIDQFKLKLEPNI
jgi:hypothetical protein|tara:strand:- start:2121 stop:2480 length:360 start_codon:yes stop_codon:yes gene_type:complete